MAQADAADRANLGEPGRQAADGLSVVGADSVHLLLARIAFVLFCIGLVGRVLLGDTLLNLFYHYTAEGGNLAGKIHPSNYLFILAAALIYIGPGFRFRRDDLPILRATILLGAAIGAICLILIVQGRTAALGYIIDTYLLTLLAIVTMLALPFSWRAAGAAWIIGALVVNSLVAIGEFVSGRYIIPFEVAPAEFRPAGLLAYALTTGVTNLAAILMLLSTRLHLALRFGGVVILAATIFITASRTSMIVGAMLAPLAIVLTAWERKDGVSAGASLIIMILSAIVIVPVVLLIGFELGLFARFSDGIFDDSAKTRVAIYGVFEYVGWSEIIWGADVNAIRKIANERLGIQIIESPFVTFIFSFGLPGTALFLLMLVYLFFQLSRNTHPVLGIALLAFLVVASTNNTLSTKVPSFCVAVLMAIGMRAYHRRIGRI